MLCFLASVAVAAARPLVAQQITWLYTPSLADGAAFVGDVVGMDEVSGLLQKDECRIFHAAPGHYWGVCNTRPSPECAGQPEGPHAPPVTYTIVVEKRADVDSWHSFLSAKNASVRTTDPGQSAEFGCYGLNFYDLNPQGLPCYRFEVQSFDDPAWPAPACKPIRAGDGVEAA